MASIAIADDYSDADGITILNFKQAQNKAANYIPRTVLHAAADKHGQPTVASVITSYLAFLEEAHKSPRDARYRANAFILPKFGNLTVDALTTDMLDHWLTELAAAPARLHTKSGQTQRYREAVYDDEAKRRRRATANRSLAVLKAALNRALRDGGLPLDAAWQRVKPFENVDPARVRYLTVDEAKRLVNSCERGFNDLVQAALQTGARYSELIALIVGDFNRDAGTILIRQSKVGKSRHIILTKEGLSFFNQICVGRAGPDLIFETTGMGGKKSQARLMVWACAQAKINPPITFHGLRHTYASLSVMAGVPLHVVARNLGHSDTRMVEKYCGYLDQTTTAAWGRGTDPGADVSEAG